MTTQPVLTAPAPEPVDLRCPVTFGHHEYRSSVVVGWATWEDDLVRRRRADRVRDLCPCGVTRLVDL